MWLKLYEGFKMPFLALVGKIIFKIAGWNVTGSLPVGVKKCVMIAAPHTSNWDIVFTRAAFAIMRIPVRFTIKREWIRTPLGMMLLFLGALPIDRRPKNVQSKPKSMVEAMSDLFEKREQLTILITPEGTRSLSKEWRTGFYHVAKSAGVPIALGFLDYKNKLAGIGSIVYPSEDMVNDMKQIMDFYRNITPKFPEKFSLDINYI
jgi:1-acyl-sn-glycerol-3-phosphate acyltransferase